MKKIILLLAVIVSLAGCSKDATPDNQIYGTMTLSRGWVPQGPGKAPLEIVDTIVTIQPTWGQANTFAAMRGDHSTWNSIAIILFALFCLVVANEFFQFSWFPNIEKVKGVLMALLLALSLVSAKWQSASIKWNNDKKVSKASFDKAMIEARSTKPIWDSLAGGCHIAWGPYNCYEK